MSEDQPVEMNFRPTASVQSTSLISYESRGHCLVIGPLEAGLEAIAQLNVSASTLLVPDSRVLQADRQATETGIRVITVNLLVLTGHLGAYDCAVGDAESPGSLAKIAGVSLLGGFDTVLDLSPRPLLSFEVPPFGYYATRGNAAELERAVAALPELEGEFEKPKYFAYDASICAHARSGITACTNCIDLCGTGAIRSDGDGVSVEPYLCQGCGSCTSSCPSGAMTYAYPKPADAFSQLAALIRQHREDGADRTVVYLHDTEDGQQRLNLVKDELLPEILPVAVEEVGSIGLDGWLCALAYGAAGVLVDYPAGEGAMRRGLQTQGEIANQILAGMGLTGERIRLVDGAHAESIIAAASELTPTEVPPARFKAFNDKRQTTRMALDHLLATLGAEQESVSLPAEAPFGGVAVDTDACTLCLACVTVCPARALQDGETLPQLKLIESNCLQCGTCEQACPENAISLSPRFLYDSEQALKPRILNEEQPFNCVVCNKPFATQQIIGRMMTKLSGHWMFEDDKAKRRLKMCEDCRVVDIFENESGIDVHKT
jgi:ferredoxin